MRGPLAGSGLLMVEGRQYPFCTGPLWKSEIAPRPGLLVDIDFGEQEQILAITAVAEEKTAVEEEDQSRNLLHKLAARLGVSK